MDGIYFYYADHCCEFGRHADSFWKSAEFVFVRQISDTGFGIYFYHVLAIFIFHYFDYHYLFDFCKIHTYEVNTGQPGKVKRKKDGADDGATGHLYIDCVSWHSLLYRAFGSYRCSRFC